MKTVLRAILFCVCSAMLLAGCAQLNVGHLERKPWRLQQSETLSLKFWRFEYQPLPQEERYSVRGRAYPLVQDLPEWATHVEELWFAVYLNDSQGRVLAKDVQVLPPSDLTPKVIEQGLPFEFTLQPEDIGQSGPLYVTFGYRMVLTPPPTDAAAQEDQGDKQESEQEDERIFFANEGALSPL